MDNLTIELKYNKGFSWHHEDSLYFKGYLFDNDECLEDYSAIKYLKKLIDNTSDLKNTIKSLNGIFSFVYAKENETIICTDRVRTFPIYFKEAAEKTIISDDAQFCSEGKNSIDENSLTEFLHTGYVTGKNTLLKGVFQVQAGEYIVFNEKNSNRYSYHNYTLQGKTEKDIGITSLALLKIIDNITDRLSRSLQGKTAIIPLSGGYDSRLIAVMLKNKGIKDVICFTYGRKGNPEVEISERVAKLLGFKWHFIEYNEKLIKNYIKTEDFQEYFEYSANYASMFYMQEYFAVKELKKIIPENSVFIPGHSGDFFAGSHLDNNVINSIEINEIAHQILNKHYNLRKVTSNIKNTLSQKITDQIQKENTNINYSLFENWDLKERQAKFIVNSSRIYEHFGFEHRLPLMDKELMDLFVNVDISLKKNKLLYDKVLKEKYFQKYNLNLENEIQASKNDIRVQKIKESIKKILPSKFINRYKYGMNKIGDTYYYIEITNYMKEELITAGIQIDESGRDKNSVIVQWYIYKIGEK